LLPYDSAQLQGWGAALVLIIIILGINLAVRYHFANKKGNGILGQLIKRGEINKK
jgi:phosphate transport system permease protein